MPDGSILTAFGTGYRSHDNGDGLPTPMDVGLVQWRLNEVPEPSALILAGTGLLALAGHFWRKRTSWPRR